jgi:fructokinase
MPHLIHWITMTDLTPRLAGVEIGGTKAIAVLGDGTDIIERYHVATTDAETTLRALHATLERWNGLQPIAALGVASFGPVGIIRDRADYGRMLLTPKPGWTGADVLCQLAGSVAGPAALDLDVNAAALAEGQWGAAIGCSDFAYITVGTGIGVGIVSSGRIVTGQMHPEAGHMRVRRYPGDDFPGICEFHGDCLAGLGSGPALLARTGVEGSLLSADHPVWATVIDALAEACASLFMTLACERIVIGGGVAVGRPGLVGAVAEACARKLGGFPPYIAGPAPIGPAGLKADAGPRGALLLAKGILSDRC